MCLGEERKERCAPRIGSRRMEEDKTTREGMVSELQLTPSAKEGNMALNFNLQSQIIFFILYDHSLIKSGIQLIK